MVIPDIIDALYIIIATKPMTIASTIRRMMTFTLGPFLPAAFVLLINLLLFLFAAGRRLYFRSEAQPPPNGYIQGAS